MKTQSKYEMSRKRDL